MHTTAPTRVYDSQHALLPSLQLVTVCASGLFWRGIFLLELQLFVALEPLLSDQLQKRCQSRKVVVYLVLLTVKVERTSLDFLHPKQKPLRTFYLENPLKM